MPVLRYYSSVAQPATLTSNITNSATSIAVDTVTGFPISFPYTLAIDWGASTEELVDVTGAAGTTLTITRGVDGTSAQSHGLGAAVRHVASGRDFSDYQNHQNSTSAVHGVTGTVVGTSDTQTLSNKTLTAATLSGGGAISGTWTGAPTFSGAVTLSGGGTISGTWAGSPTLSGTVTHTGAIQSTRAATTDVAFSSILDAGDTFDRFRILEDGKLEWGSGTSARDVVLYRDAADIIATDDTIRVYRPSTGADALSVRVTGDVSSRMVVDADGAIAWGPGSGAQDVFIQRVGVDTLQCGGGWQVDTYVRAAASEAVAGSVTAASGFTVSSSAATVSAGIVSVWVQLTRTGADLNASAVGNLTDTDLCTLPTGWRPPSTLIGSAQWPAIYMASFTSGSIGIFSTGLVRLQDAHSSSTIATGDTVRFGATFPQV